MGGLTNFAIFSIRYTQNYICFEAILTSTVCMAECLVEGVLADWSLDSYSLYRPKPHRKTQETSTGRKVAFPIRTSLHARYMQDT